MEKQLSEIMSEKSFDGGFTYRADEVKEALDIK